MSRTTDLGELYLEELKDIYNAEQQILKALPAMSRAASSDELKGGLDDHLESTKRQIARIEDIFQAYDQPAIGKHCKGMAGLLEEAKKVIEEDMDPDVKDAALIAAAQGVERYEMAVYGSLRTFARVLGDAVSARLLQTTLEEEGQADRELTRLAEEAINVRAHADETASRDEARRSSKQESLK